MPSAQPISARNWVASRSISDPRPSPDGTTVAFVVTNGSDAHLATMPLEGGAESWLPCEPPIQRSGGVLDWMPDGTAIVYLGSDGCVHVIDLDTLGCRPVTTESQPVSSLRVAPDGRQAAYVVDTADVMVVNLDGAGAPRRLSSGADFVVDPCWSPDSALVAWHEWDVPAMAWDASRICVRDAAGVDAIRTVFAQADASVAQPRFSPDGTYLSFLCDAGGYLNVWTSPVADLSSSQALIGDQVEHGGPTWGPGAGSYAWSLDSQALYFSRNIAGWGSLWLYQLSSGERTHVDDGSYNNVSATNAGVVAVRRTPASAGALVHTNGNGESRILLRSSIEGVADGIEPKLVQWNNSDGEVIHGRLYQPTHSIDEAPPLLVWVHGGPHGQSPVTAYARFGYFVQRGWAVLVVDYRGSTGWGRQYAQALNGNWGRSDVDDVVSGIQAAHANGWGASEATAVYGSSAGGFTALLVAIHRPDLVSAVAAMQPVSDLVSLAEETWRFEAHYTDQLVGPLPDAVEEYHRRSPITSADQLRRPLLLLHGDNDNVVPVGDSQRLADAVTANGGQVEFRIYEGEGHGWRNSATEIDELERMETFLGKYVLHNVTTTEETT